MFTTKLLPELKGLQHLVQGLRASQDRPLSQEDQVQQPIKIFRNGCECASCHDKRKYGHFSPSLIHICLCDVCSSAPRLDLKQVQDLVTSYVCLELIATTISEFLWILSRLEFDDAIKPSLSGLAMLFYEGKSEFLSWPLKYWEKLPTRLF